jgi:hypothetical protein
VPDRKNPLERAISASEFSDFINAAAASSTGYVVVTAKDFTGTVFAARGETRQIPTIIREAPPNRPIRVALAVGGFGAFLGISSKSIEDVRLGISLLHMVGEITYEDVFGDSHRTPFHYIWYATDESTRDVGDDSAGQWVSMEPNHT